MKKVNSFVLADEGSFTSFINIFSTVFGKDNDKFKKVKICFKLKGPKFKEWIHCIVIYQKLTINLINKYY